MRVRDLTPGVIVDLQGDRYADKGTHPEFEFEGERVDYIIEETDNCIVVSFESGFVCAFPSDHELGEI